MGDSFYRKRVCGGCVAEPEADFSELFDCSGDSASAGDFHGSFHSGGRVFQCIGFAISLPSCAFVCAFAADVAGDG